MARMKKKPEVNPYPIVVETFRDMGRWEADNMKQTTPSCFNGSARIIKYRITVEKIEEPIEVYHARLQELWDKSDNWHDHEPLVVLAKKYNYEFTGMRGSKKEAR